MTDDVRQQGGIRNRMWIAGRFVERDPVPIQVTPKRFDAKVRTSNLGMRIDRPFTMAGMPNIRNRREFVLPWSDLREPGLLEHLDTLAAIGQPFGLGLWKQDYDVFDGDGANKTFYLQRRQLLPAVTPPTSFPDYPTRVTVYDRSYLEDGATPTSLTVVAKTSSDIDTGDPGAGEAWIEGDGHQVGNLWVSKMRLETAPPDAHDCVVVAYLPLYQVVIDTDQPRSYGIAGQEPRSIRMVEFG